MNPETKFKNKIMPRLRQIPSSYWFVKEAVNIVGIPDIIGCINGKFVGLELKREEYEANKGTGRVVRQKREGYRIKKAKGHHYFTYPENFEEVYKKLLLLTK
jgi:hypothetical protein